MTIGLILSFRQEAILLCRNRGIFRKFVSNNYVKTIFFGREKILIDHCWKYLKIAPGYTNAVICIGWQISSHTCEKCDKDKIKSKDLECICQHRFLLTQLICYSLRLNSLTFLELCRFFAGFFGLWLFEGLEEATAWMLLLLLGRISVL